MGSTSETPVLDLLANMTADSVEASDLDAETLMLVRIAAITTAWNVLFAIVLIVSVFGWKGGKLLVEQSYTDAKVKVAEQKEQHAEKKAEKKAEREASGHSRFHRGSNNDAAEEPASSAAGGEEPDA